MITFPRRVVTPYRIRERLEQCDIEVRKGPHKLRPVIRCALIWLLKKFDAFPNHLATVKLTTYQQVTEESYVRGLNLSTRNLDQIWGGGYRLYVGPTTFHGIHDEILSKAPPFNFQLEMELCRGNDQYREVRMCGVPVTYVPWLDGHVLLPKVNDESSSGPRRRFG